MQIKLVAMGVAAGLLLSGSAFAAGDAEKGKTVFKQCAACHKVVAGEKSPTGPNLAGVVGRAAGTGDFAYSDAMKKSGISWAADSIDAYLADPKGKIPGNKMAFPGLKKPEDRADVIAYLSTLK